MWYEAAKRCAYRAGRRWASAVMAELDLTARLRCPTCLPTAPRARGAVAPDAALGAVLAGGREPTLSQIKLVWWRDSLAKLGEGRPPAEPVLEEVAAHILPRGIKRRPACPPGGSLVDLLSHEPLSPRTSPIRAWPRVRCCSGSVPVCSGFPAQRAGEAGGGGLGACRPRPPQQRGRRAGGAGCCGSACGGLLPPSAGQSASRPLWHARHAAVRDTRARSGKREQQGLARPHGPHVPAPR
jgi:hypothetical protein